MLNRLTVITLLMLVAGCQPADEPLPDNALDTTVKELDKTMLPNEYWRLSEAVIELSFCQNRVNESLLGSESELNGWRLTEDVTAFPPYRQDGLQALQQLLAGEQFMLWQRDGSVSAQRYFLVLPASVSKGDVAEQVFPAVATLASAREICHTAVIDTPY